MKFRKADLEKIAIFEIAIASHCLEGRGDELENTIRFVTQNGQSFYYDTKAGHRVIIDDSHEYRLLPINKPHPTH